MNAAVKSIIVYLYRHAMLWQCIQLKLLYLPRLTLHEIIDGRKIIFFHNLTAVLSVKVAIVTAKCPK